MVIDRANIINPILSSIIWQVQVYGVHSTHSRHRGFVLIESFPHSWYVLLYFSNEPSFLTNFISTIDKSKRIRRTTIVFHPLQRADFLFVLYSTTRQSSLYLVFDFDWCSLVVQEDELDLFCQSLFQSLEDYIKEEDTKMISSVVSLFPLLLTHHVESTEWNCVPSLLHYIQTHLLYFPKDLPLIPSPTTFFKQYDKYITTKYYWLKKNRTLEYQFLYEEPLLDAMLSFFQALLPLQPSIPSSINPHLLATCMTLFPLSTLMVYIYNMETSPSFLCHAFSLIYSYIQTGI